MRTDRIPVRNDKNCRNHYSIKNILIIIKELKVRTRQAECHDII